MAFPDGWRYRWPIAIHADSVITSPVSAWPCLVTDVHFPAAAWDVMNADASDLRFSSDEAGLSELYYDAPRISVAGESAHLYVQVPTLSSTEDTTIWAWVGNAKATAPSAAWMQATYPDEFLAVFAFQEGSGLVSAERTGGTDATLSATIDWITAPFGNYALQMEDAEAALLDDGGPLAAGFANCSMLIRMAPNEPGEEADGGSIAGRFADGGSARDTMVDWSFVWTGLGAGKIYRGRLSNVALNSTTAPANGEWVTLALTKAGVNAAFYVNGISEDTTGAAAATLNTNYSMTRIGSAKGDTYCGADIQVESFYLLNRAATPDEVKVHHAQYSAPGTWASAGELVAVGGGAVLPMFGGYNLGKSLLRGANL